MIPSTVERAESLRIIDAIPPEVVRHYAFCGTPEQVARELHEYREAGLAPGHVEHHRLRRPVAGHVVVPGDGRAEEAGRLVSRAAVEGYFAAINADAFADLAEVFAPEVTIHTVGAEPVVGCDAALAHFATILSAYATHEDRATRWIEGVDDGSDDAIVCDIAFTGTLADGREVRFDALDVFDVHDGRITRVATWYDTRSVAPQVRG